MNGDDLRSQFDAEFDTDTDFDEGAGAACPSYTCVNLCCY